MARRETVWAGAFLGLAVLLWSAASAAQTGVYVRLDGWTGLQSAAMADRSVRPDEWCAGLAAFTPGCGGAPEFGLSFSVGGASGPRVPIRPRSEYGVGRRPGGEECEAGLGCLNGESTSWAVMFNSFVNVPLQASILRPFIGAGLGLARRGNDDRRLSDSIGPSSLGAGRGPRFAWHFSAGSGITIVDRWEAEIGYRFVDLGRNAKRGDFSAPLTAVSADSAPKGHEMMLGLRLRF